MTDRLWTLFRLLGSRGAAAQTAHKPNSWAIIALWRRAFQLKEEEEEEEIQSFAEAVEELLGAKSIRPVADPEVMEIRKEFVQEHHRNLALQRREQMERTMQAMQEQQIHRPNLDVPVGDHYVNLAQ